MRNSQSKIAQFIQLESFSGIVLCLFAAAGLLLANSPAGPVYESILYQHKLSLIINDGLMPLFFLLAGCEIKREILGGELNSSKKILLPFISAFSGMAVPALIYVLFNHAYPHLLRGWAIPTATDIAFALAILSLAGKHAPLSLKAFITAVAIFDDLGAILIIAFFYTQTLNWHYILTGLAVFLCLALVNFFKKTSLYFYMISGLLLWYCLFKSGIHPTVAGVLLAMTIPAHKLDTLEKNLHPWVAYGVLPLFALANTGIGFFNSAHNTVSFLSLTTSTLSLGIILGLWAGKQIGVFLAVWISVKTGIASLPEGCNFRMIYGASLLCGIGFTMSLFIGSLAFNDARIMESVRISILIASIIAGITGYGVLRMRSKNMAG